MLRAVYSPSFFTRLCLKFFNAVPRNSSVNGLRESSRTRALVTGDEIHITSARLITLWIRLEKQITLNSIPSLLLNNGREKNAPRDSRRINLLGYGFTPRLVRLKDSGERILFPDGPGSMEASLHRREAFLRLDECIVPSALKKTV